MYGGLIIHMVRHNISIGFKHIDQCLIIKFSGNFKIQDSCSLLFFSLYEDGTNFNIYYSTTENLMWLCVAISGEVNSWSIELKLV